MQLTRFYYPAFFTLSILMLALPVGAQQALGSWREHLSFQSAIAVDHGPERVWAASPFGIFSYSPSDRSTERFGRVSGLSEAAVVVMAADKQRDRIIIGYRSGTIDILEGLKVRSIDAINRLTTPADKTINHITIQDDRAYISTGFGLIILNLEKAVIEQTAYIGSGGNAVSVKQAALVQDSIYTATGQGLKVSKVPGTNLQDFRNWRTIGITEGIPGIGIQFLAAGNNKLYAASGETIYLKTDNGFVPIYSASGVLRHIRWSDDKLICIEETAVGSRVFELLADGNTGVDISHYPLSDPRQALRFGGELYIADSVTGLHAYRDERFESLVPNTPYAVAAGDLLFSDGQLFAAAAKPFDPHAGNQNGIYRLRDQQWSNHFILSDTLSLLHTLAADPSGTSVWAGSYGGGLIHWKADGSYTVLQDANRIGRDRRDPSKTNIGGLAFDTAGNLWITASGADENLSVIKADGTALKFVAPFPVSRILGKIMVDAEDQKWILLPEGNGIAVFNHGFSVDDAGDDQWKWLRAGAGQGNLPSDDVRAMAVDKNGIVWIGTTSGIGVIQCPQMLFTTQGCEALWPVVQQDNFAGYLFAGETVEAIAVDAANRKWIGTHRGVWLISEDGEELLQHFTTTNSPLASNRIFNIAIDHTSGEIIFSTSSGISIFRGSAIEGALGGRELVIYPNPVSPDYTGPIAIRGLKDGDRITISTSNGRRIYEGRALGGQAIWNGLNPDGRRVASGVYLVLVHSTGTKSSAAGKIIIINK